MAARRLILLIAGVGVLAGASGSAGDRQTHLRCFGAAARDPAHRCQNPALARLVIPTPHRALRLPNARCGFLRLSVPFVCRFGAPASRARSTIALVGDSHATHWRAALGPVAEAKRWHGLSVTRAGCPFSVARPVLPARLLGACLRWRTALVAWFVDHPEVRTVFVSGHPVGVVARPGRAFPVAVAGYRRAWGLLPHTVRRIVVLRDTPISPPGTQGCVARAIAAHRPAGVACAVSRRVALRGDPAAAAARRNRSDRVDVVDLTHFMCDARRCFPVVGGALVHKDESHLTATFGATLAPYLRRALGRLRVR